MNDPEDDTPRDSATPAYEPPAVAWEETFDPQANLASACAKLGGQDVQCDTQPTS